MSARWDGNVPVKVGEVIAAVVVIDAVAALVVVVIGTVAGPLVVVLMGIVDTPLGDTFVPDALPDADLLPLADVEALAADDAADDAVVVGVGIAVCTTKYVVCFPATPIILKLYGAAPLARKGKGALSVCTAALGVGNGATGRVRLVLQSMVFDSGGYTHRILRPEPASTS